MHTLQRYLEPLGNVLQWLCRGGHQHGPVHGSYSETGPCMNFRLSSFGRSANRCCHSGIQISRASCFAEQLPHGEDRRGTYKDGLSSILRDHCLGHLPPCDCYHHKGSAKVACGRKLIS